MDGKRAEQTVLGRLNDAEPEEWDSLILHDFNKDADSIFNGRHKPVAKSAADYKPQLKSWGIDCPVKTAKDTQEGGSHYLTSHQPLYIVLDTEGYEAFRGSCLVKVYKYLQRKKESRLKDYKKARHVLDMLIEETEKGDL